MNTSHDDWNTLHLGRHEDLTLHSAQDHQCAASHHDLEATYLALSPLIVVMNGLILLTVVLVHELHKPHDVMMAMVAVTDMTVGVIYIPLKACAVFYPELLEGSRTPCTILYLSNSCLDLSLTSNLTRSAVRSIAVNFPFWYDKNITNRRIMLLVASLAGVDILIKAVFIVTTMTFDDSVPICERCTMHRNFPAWYYMIYGPTVMSVQLILSFVLCVHIIVVAKHTWRDIKHRNSLNNSHQERPSVVPIICSGLFIVLWTPKLFIFTLTKVGISNTPSIGIAYVVVSYLKISNSFLNPLVFCSKKPMYQKSFRIILRTPFWRPRKMMCRLREEVYQQSVNLSTTSGHSGHTQRPGGRNRSSGQEDRDGSQATISVPNSSVPNSWSSDDPIPGVLEMGVRSPIELASEFGLESFPVSQNPSWLKITSKAIPSVDAESRLLSPVPLSQ